MTCTLRENIDQQLAFDDSYKISLAENYHFQWNFVYVCAFERSSIMMKTFSGTCTLGGQKWGTIDFFTQKFLASSNVIKCEDSEMNNIYSL